LISITTLNSDNSNYIILPKIPPQCFFSTKINNMSKLRPSSTVLSLYFKQQNGDRISLPQTLLRFSGFSSIWK